MTRKLPGALAFVCAVAGTYLLAGPGPALLVAAALLLVLDHRIG